jgi:phosphoribosylanthranilate isomerase
MAERGTGSNVKIKICGLFRDRDVDYANAAPPDYAGFVFAEKSRRRVSPEKALRMRERLAPQIIPVGVFADADMDLIIRLYESGVVGMAQLHGDESERYIADLKRMTGIPVIRAVRADDADSVKIADEGAADFILLDSGAGGSGITFDWSLIGEPRKPYFLAGGINAANVARALALKPFAIDVSGGAETDGLKDKDKIALLVGETRRLTEY